MTRADNSQARLERTLDAAETLLLSMSDEAVLSASSSASTAHLEVQALVAARLHRLPSPVARPHPVRQGKLSAKAGRPDSLIAFLGQLAAARPDLSPRLHAAFASGKAPSRSETEALAIELLKSRLERD